jgi:hypothetical protein
VCSCTVSNRDTATLAGNVHPKTVLSWLNKDVAAGSDQDGA